MEFRQCTVFLTIIAMPIRLMEAIPDKSLVWVAREKRLYYSPRVEEWTQAKITPTEFGTSLTAVTLNGTKSINGMAGDIPTRHFVSSDRLSQNLLIYDIDAQQATFFHLGTSKDIGQLTIDWLGRNVYWTDTGYGWIAMKRLPDNINQHNSADPNFRLVVDKYLERPTGLVVHPEKYFLFWTDTGITAKIERSNLIGEKRTIIIWQSLITPTSLCIDQSADRLYWSDPARGTIEYSDFDGNGRTILLSDPYVDYYGIAVFQDSLIYTAPAYNRTGFVSLKENNEGQHIQSSIQYENFKFYQIMVYASELQEISTDALCDKVQECDQMCLHREQDAGYTCLCDDGYELVAGRYCRVDERVLERHILFANGNNICSVAISVLGLSASTVLDVHCDLVTNDTVITRFSVDMTKRVMFYTNGTSIFKQTAFKDNRVVLYDTDKTITDMDYDWKTEQLYWIESGEGDLYYIDVNTDAREPDKKKLTDLDVTNVAVDPHNGKIFWIMKDVGDLGTTYTLNAWNIAEDDLETIQTSLLSTPTDLEYDRLKDRLLWNDDDSHIGMINTDGTGERKYDITSTGETRHAITVYKNFILTTSAENWQFEIIYELDPKTRSRMDLHTAYDGPVHDFHVYESALQPSDLEPCEVDNGGCEHICLPGNELKCACFLGYVLDEDMKSCKSGILSDNFFVILDTVTGHGELYQVDQETKTPYAIEIDAANIPSALTFDPKRKNAIWVDIDIHAVKKMRLGSTEEIAVRSGVDETSTVTVDVSTGNIYISTGGEIIVVSPSLDTATIVDSSAINGDIGKIALMPESGLMSWYESGASLRLMIGNMDGTNVRPITVPMDTPEDIVFDLEDDRSLFWCDSGLDKIEKIDIQSLASTNIYKDRGLKPTAIEIDGDVIYLVPKQQRKIVQINKRNGLQQMDVFESPLFGSINDFFLSRTTIKGHELCGVCNGECSGLCLPIGKRRRCACGEGISLKDDETTCQYANVCPKESYTSVSGLESLRDCCPSLPDAVCRPECQSGYNKQSSITVVKCWNGKWNVTLDNICKASRRDGSNTDDPPGGESNIVYIAAGAGGGAALLTIVIVVCICICRRKRNTKGNEHVEHNHDYADGYARANGVLSPDPPAPTSEPEAEVYDTLNEKYMIDAAKLKVMLPSQGEDSKIPTDRKSSTSSGRYSKFPIDYGYLTPSFTDFHDYSKGGNPDGDDGYLRASGSQRDVSDGSFGYDPNYRHRDRQNDGDSLAVRFTKGNGRKSFDAQVIGRRSWDTGADRLVRPASFAHSGHI